MFRSCEDSRLDRNFRHGSNVLYTLMVGSGAAQPPQIPPLGRCRGAFRPLRTSPMVGLIRFELKHALACGDHSKRLRQSHILLLVEVIIEGWLVHDDEIGALNDRLFDHLVACQKRCDDAPYRLVRIAGLHGIDGIVRGVVGCRGEVAPATIKRATAIVEQHGIGLLMRSQITLVNNWLQRLPAALLEARPLLALVAAWTYMAARDLDALEHVLNVTPALQAADLSAEVQSQLLIFRACLAIFRGEFVQAVAYARQGLPLVPATNLGVRATALLMIGSGLAQANDWLGAEPILAETTRVGKAGGNLHNAVVAYCMLGKLQIARGDVAQALQTLHEALHAATQPGQPPLPVVGLIYIGLGTIWVDQGRYDQAALYLQRGEVLAKACFELSELINGWRAQVKLHRALANPDQAAHVLDEAETWLSQIMLPQFMRQQMLAALHTLRNPLTQPLEPLTRLAVTASSQGLVEPLSERELEVLKLVSQGLSNSDIAHKLIVTVGTVKKHLNNCAILGTVG
jgi:ATP/maltotriose-dependent transcriptional regulator MalT